MDRARRSLLICVAWSSIGCATTIEPSYVTATSEQLVGWDATAKRPTTATTEILRAYVFVPQTVSAGRRILLQSDGSYEPAYDTNDKSAANVYIEMQELTNGSIANKVSNDARTDWSFDNRLTTHSFNVIGAPLVTPGKDYLVRVLAEAAIGANGHLAPFKVSANASLAVMAPRATANVEEQALTADDPGDANGYGFSNVGFLPDDQAFLRAGSEPRSAIVLRDDVYPHIPVLGLSHDGAFVSGEPWIVLASGSSYIAAPAQPGDAMWGLFVDGYDCGNQYSTWTVNDLQTGSDARSEAQAPMYLQGYFDSLPCRTNTTLLADVHYPISCPIDPRPPEKPGPVKQGPIHRVTLEAIRFPLHCGQIGVNNTPVSNNVTFRVAKGARMVFLSGGMQVRGSASFGHDVNSAVDTFTVVNATPDPSVQPAPPRAPPAEIVLAKTSLTIPANHNGVVFFTAKTRNFGHTGDESGSYSMWIEICEPDAKAVSCARVLQTSPRSIQVTALSDSQRTLSASYLTTQSNRLVAGKTYVVQVKGRVDLPRTSDNTPTTTGSYKIAELAADVPLIWFDGEGAAP
jgi:hypothetical protein